MARPRPSGMCTHPERTQRRACNACRNEQGRRRYNALAQRGYQYKAKYGVTIEWYEETLAAQGGVCAACGTVDPRAPGGVFVIDHDHGCCPGKKTCGECIRSLLCGPCNLVLGLTQESEQVLLAIISYLKGVKAS